MRLSNIYKPEESDANILDTNDIEIGGAVVGEKSFAVKCPCKYFRFHIYLYQNSFILTFILLHNL